MSSHNGIELSSSADDMVYKRLLHELLKNQSVASWAATALDTESRCVSTRKGVPIIGRNGQDYKPETSPEPVTPSAPQLDQNTVAALLRSLVTEKSHLPSDSGSDASSDISMTSSAIKRSMSVPGEQQIIGTKTMNMDRFKTELCRQFQETGFCKYGAKCQFAHGHHELRNVSRHQKYKTEMCRTYHTTGLCPYGTRCHFIHDEEELIQKHQSRSRNVAHRSVTRHASLPVHGSRVFNPAVGSYTDGSMGSVGDTPPSSISSSPAPSPTGFLYEERAQSLPLPPTSAVFQNPPPGFSAPPPTAPPQAAEVFTFKNIPTPQAETSPLNLNIPVFTPANSLAAGLQAINPSFGRDLAQDSFSDFYYMPSSPTLCVDSDSESQICESPMDISRNLRLPIFSQLSKE